MTGQNEKLGDGGETTVKPVVDSANPHAAEETPGADIPGDTRNQLTMLWSKPQQAAAGTLMQVDPNNPWQAQQHQMELEAKKCKE